MHEYWAHQKIITDATCSTHQNQEDRGYWVQPTCSHNTAWPQNIHLIHMSMSFPKSYKLTWKNGLQTTQHWCNINACTPPWPLYCRHSAPCPQTSSGTKGGGITNTKGEQQYPPTNSPWFSKGEHHPNHTTGKLPDFEVSPPNKTMETPAPHMAQHAQCTPKDNTCTHHSSTASSMRPIIVHSKYC